MYSASHTWLLRLNLGVVDVFGGVDRGFTIHTILIARCGFGRVQTGLADLSREKAVRGCSGLTWIRFLPSALVTSGWSFGVVKV